MHKIAHGRGKITHIAWVVDPIVGETLLRQDVTPPLSFVLRMCPLYGVRWGAEVVRLPMNRIIERVRA